MNLIIQNSMKDSNDDESTLDLEYKMPFLSHAAIESTNCTAHVTSSSCEIWAPTQSQSICFDKILEITDIPEENITIHTPYVGGGFGRRIKVDEVAKAIAYLTSKESGLMTGSIIDFDQAVDGTNSQYYSTPRLTDDLLGI